MATYYVWSGATGSGNGSSWANAYTSLHTAMSSGSGTGNTFYVAHDHSETLASGNVYIHAAFANTNPYRVVCVNRAGSVPPVSADRRATAVVSSNGNNNVLFDASGYIDGIIFIAGNSTGTALIQLAQNSNRWLRLDNCSLRIGSTGAGSINFAGMNGTYVEMNNTTLSFAAAGQTFWMHNTIRWRNTPSALLGTVPNALFNLESGSSGVVECIGVDLSAAGSGKIICNNSTTCSLFRFQFIDCKFDASVTKSQVPAGYGLTEIDAIRSGASGTNYTIYRDRMSGQLIEETTIVRTGGASDGTTTIAWKIVTTANCTYFVPFECPPIAIWNDTTGSSVTATVEGIWGGGAVPLDDEIWLDVEYLGSSSSPQGSFVNDGKADVLTTAANQTSSAETWGGSTTKFKLAVSFTPQQKGWIYARVKIGKASSTFYVDPLVTLT